MSSLTIGKHVEMLYVCSHMYMYIHKTSSHFIFGNNFLLAFVTHRLITVFFLFSSILLKCYMYTVHVHVFNEFRLVLALKFCILHISFYKTNIMSRVGADYTSVITIMIMMTQKSFWIIMITITYQNFRLWLWLWLL